MMNHPLTFVLLPVFAGLFLSSCGKPDNRTAIEQMRDAAGGAPLPPAPEMVCEPLGIEMTYERLTATANGGQQYVAQFKTHGDAPVFHAGSLKNRPAIVLEAAYRNSDRVEKQDIPDPERRTELSSGLFLVTAGTIEPVQSIKIRLPLWSENGEKFVIELPRNPSFARGEASPPQAGN